MTDHTTVVDVALGLVLNKSGPGGLDLTDDELGRLTHLLKTAADETRILSKSVRALAGVLPIAKEVMKQCPAPAGNPDLYDRRVRAIGLVEDLSGGLATTDEWRLKVLAEAVAGHVRPAPETGGGASPLLFRRPKGRKGRR